MVNIVGIILNDKQLRCTDMVKEVEIRISPDHIDDDIYIKAYLAKKCKIAETAITSVKLIKRSIDARKKDVVYQLRYLVGIDQKIKPTISDIKYQQAQKNTKRVTIVGAGPAGYFAALHCLELGLKPIVLDRGKDVRARRRDLKAIQQDGVVDPNSNYCFGEGGAGTYSDGKLYTRSHKRGNIKEVLQILVDHGAKDDILIDAHPHIGSNKLPGIIANMRATIRSNGGEIHFDTKVTDLVIRKNRKVELQSEDGKVWPCDKVVFATGHSARDIYRLFHTKKIAMELKPFALGVRIEHPQELIDKIQYAHAPRHKNLPAASYKVVSQVDKKGVFSFCMCPGGLVVPSATQPGEIVVNGMSLSKRDSAYANSGVVTEVGTLELEAQGYEGVFAALDFQAKVEQQMFQASDGSQRAPAQRLVDFVEGKGSANLSDTSYIPGLISSPLHELLPDFIYERLRKGVMDFDKKLKGYHTQEANVIGVESRTSSPIRIPRDKLTYAHPEFVNLYPCGEGAGYAGGILSAALDGRNIVKAIHTKLNNA